MFRAGRRAGVWLVLVACATSCGAHRPDASRTRSARASDVAPERRIASPLRAVEGIAAQLRVVRGLQGEGSDPGILVVSDDEFDKIWRESISQSPDLGARASRFFGLWVRNATGTGASNGWRPSRSYIAMYSPVGNSILLRRAVFGDSIRLEPLAIKNLAHEVEHALQQGTISKVRQDATLDAALAHRALVEGDAEAAAYALLASFGKTSFSRVIDGIEPKITTPRSGIFLRVLAMAYVDGTKFVFALYKSGGFIAVNDAMTSSVDSTAQILHPEKYRTRVDPVDPGTPTAPVGFKEIAADTAGEFAIGEILALCMKPDDARHAASDWSGDSFTIGEAADGHKQISWLTQWDTQAAAVRFSDAARAAGECLSRQSGFPSVDVMQRDRFVAIAAGQLGALNRAQAEQTLAVGEHLHDVDKAEHNAQ